MHASNLPLRRCLPFFAVVLLVATVGCEEKPGIQTYDAPRTGSNDRIPAVHQASSQQPSPQRLPDVGEDTVVVTMIQDGETTWFIKARGKQLAMRQNIQQVASLIQSLSFEDSTPTWTVPEGWQEAEGNSMRVATLTKGEGEQQVEVAISKLERMGDPAEWERMNVNRWLGELGYRPVSAEGMEQLIVRGSISGRPSLILRKTGNWGAEPQLDPLAEFEPAEVATTEDTPTNADGLTYTAPEAWSKGELGPFRNDAYVAGEGADQVEITISRLGPSPLVPNVNRWRDQIGLPQQSAEEIAAAQQTLTVAGNEVPYFELTSQGETILAAIVDVEGGQWFFKLRGPSEASAAEKQRFEEFVESIEFE